MDLYRTTFGVLVAGSVALAYSQYQRDKIASRADDGRSGSVELNNAATVFKKTFIPVYLLVMGSDWLQAIIIPALILCQD
jgi:hypothetical protein